MFQPISAGDLLLSIYNYFGQKVVMGVDYTLSFAVGGYNWPIDVGVTAPTKKWDAFGSYILVQSGLLITNVVLDTAALYATGICITTGIETAGASCLFSYGVAAVVGYVGTEATMAVSEAYITQLNDP
jgi:hypothetical protein